jgi:hypothetical protein
VILAAHLAPERKDSLNRDQEFDDKKRPEQAIAHEVFVNEKKPERVSLLE